MNNDRAPLGLLVSGLGAAALGISVFMPWYGVSITAAGAVSAQQQLTAVAARYGHVRLHAKAYTMGHQLFTVSAHQAMGRVSLILLGLAGLALLASLLRLVNMRGLLYATGSQIALFGTLAGLVVLFRMLFRPGAATASISFSLSWGIVLALGSALAITAGGMIAGSDRAGARAHRKRGPGPPPLARELSRVQVETRGRH